MSYDPSIRRICIPVCSCFVSCFRNAIFYTQVILLVAPAYNDIKRHAKQQNRLTVTERGGSNGHPVECKKCTDLFCLRARAP